MPIKKGDWVRVLTVDHEGTVHEVLKTGGYKVAVKGLIILCREKDLRYLPDGPDDEELPRKKAAAKVKSKTGKSPGPSASLDLHGLRVEEAMRIVEERISSAIVSGADSLRVVHGKGTGKIQSALNKYLRGLSVVKSFRVDAKNPGVTWVYF